MARIMAEIKIIILAIILASRHQLHLNSSGRVSCRVRNPNFRTIVMLVCLLSQSRAPPEIKHNKKLDTYFNRILIDFSFLLPKF